MSHSIHANKAKTALFSFTSGVIVSKTGGYRVNIWTGFLMWTIGLGLFTMLSPSTSIAEFVGFSVISGETYLAC